MFGAFNLIKGAANYLLGGGGSGSGDKPRPIDLLAEGIDKFSYTNQEKAENGKIALGSFVEFVKSSYDENTDRSVTRRKLALRWVGVQFNLVYAWLLCLIGEAILPATINEAGAVVPSRIHVVTEGVIAINKMWWVGTLMVLAFFFGVHTLRAFGGGKKK
jgi:hypothetical protein